MKLQMKTIVVMLFACLFISLPVDALRAPETTSTTSTSTSTTSTSTTSTTIIVIDDEAKCGQWWSTARSVGFDSELLFVLDDVMFRESRCDASQLNKKDPNGGSVGLTQINRFWCLPSKYYPKGYLQTMNVLSTCDDLFDPSINLRSALALVDYSKSIGLCAWSQWAWVELPCEND